MKLKIWPFRRIAQIFFFFVFNALIFNRIIFYWNIKPSTLHLPVLVSINSPLSAFCGVFDVIQASASQGIFPLLSIAIILVLGVLIGRALCSWGCPIGFIQELIFEIKGERVTQISFKTHNQAVKLKFIILALTILVSATVCLSVHFNIWVSYREALGDFAKGPFFIFSPDGILFGTLPYLISSAIFNKGFSNLEIFQIYLLAFKMFILGLFFAGAYKISLFWCRYICPLGALMSIFGKVSFLSLNRSLTKCEKCPECVKACPMQIKILDYPWGKFNHQECILCFRCVDACKHKALTPKFP
ncbi:4Fe-4S binding protein [Candidatus Bathyarchaeota archaeon]|nr:4Fe-4S binding protein [Candidatus Bathyarchaeota archaeon]